MKRKKLVELLDQHSSALLEGRDLQEDLLAQFPYDVRTLRPMLELASSIKAAIVPIPVPLIKERLRDKLENDWLQPVSEERSIRGLPKPWVAVAALGSLISATGLLLIILRRFRIRDTRNAQTAATAL